MNNEVKLMSTSKTKVILLSLHLQITVLLKSYVITNADTAVEECHVDRSCSFSALQHHYIHNE